MINILITGDYYPGARIEALSLDGKHEAIFGDFLPEIRSADLAVTNLEAPLIEHGKPRAKTGPAIKSKPECIASLSFAGFNLLTLANNHIMDYGEEGLNSTLDACKKHGLAFVGVGQNLEEAKAPYVTEIQGIRLAILNIAENEFGTTQGTRPGASPLNPVQNFRDIQEAKAQADCVIVITHGGHETYPLPSPRMKATFRFFVDAGADVVINHHTHCASGYEVYQDKPIFYSLGNFVFDWPKPKNADWYEGYAVKLRISRKELDFEIIPYTQNKQQVGVYKQQGKQAEHFHQRLLELNKTIADDKALQQAFEAYCKKVSCMYNAYLEPHSNYWVHALQTRKWLPSFLNTRKRLLLLNLTRCEAHRDVLLEILK